MHDKDFEKALRFVLQWEGGYANDPTDKGGETNKGITHRTYDAYRKSKGLPVQNVRLITDDEVRDIYYNRYYKASGADKIQDKRLASVVFDTAVNMGPARASEFLTKSGGDYNKYLKLRKAKYEEFIQADPTQVKYRNGWNNRVNKLESYVNTNFESHSPEGNLDSPRKLEQSGNSDEYWNAQFADFMRKNDDNKSPLFKIHASKPWKNDDETPAVHITNVDSAQVQKPGSRLKPKIDISRLYTLEDIKKMSAEELNKNYDAIMQQESIPEKSEPTNSASKINSILGNFEGSSNPADLGRI